MFIQFLKTGCYIQAVKSFLTESVGGLDSVEPSHVQDLSSAGEKLSYSQTKLYNLMLTGNIPSEICRIIYGVS